MATQQEVIKKFTASLNKTSLKGKDAVDEAIRAATKFTGIACTSRQCQEFCVIRIVDLTPFFQRKIFRVT